MASELRVDNIVERTAGAGVTVNGVKIPDFLPINSIMAIYVKTAQEVTDLMVLGWWLCDGLGGTPDLRNMFIFGGQPGNNVTGDRVLSSGATGDHAMTWGQMPEHTHASDNAKSEAGPTDPNQGEWNNWGIFNDPIHGITPGAGLQDVFRYSGKGETHKHDVGEPAHIKIGYFMYTGIPG